jgi:membrane associated rhomboid family serine protease
MRMKRDVIEYKLRHLFIPLPLLVVAFATCYSLAYWLLIARTNLVSLDEQIVGYWLPLGLSVILVFHVIRPRLRALKLKDIGSSLGTVPVPMFFYVIAVAAVAVPAIMAIGYVEKSTGDITHVIDASAIATGANTKYYSVDSICLAGSNSKSDTDVRSYKGDLTIHLYVVVPVCAQDSKAAASGTVWLGYKFKTRPSSSAGTAEYDALIRDAERTIRNEVPEQYQYLERAQANPDRKHFEAAVQSGVAQTSSPTILIPHKEPFAQRTGNRLAWVIGSFAIGCSLWFVMLLFPSLDRGELRREGDPGAVAGSRSSAAWAFFFVPTRRMYGLPILIDVNIVVFLAMVVAGLGVESFRADDLMAWGANYRPAIHGVGAYRLISSQFVHGGLLHLVNNLYGLFFAGICLTPVLKNKRMILCYLACGLGGSVASILSHPATVSVGASGAIFGLFGIALTLDLLGDKRLAVLRKFILINTTVFICFNLLLGAISRGIDNAGHVGGLITGVALGIAIFLLHRNRSSKDAYHARAGR